MVSCFGFATAKALGGERSLGQCGVEKCYELLGEDAGDVGFWGFKQLGVLANVWGDLDGFSKKVLFSLRPFLRVFGFFGFLGLLVWRISSVFFPPPR